MVQHNWNMRLFNLSQVVDHTTSSIWGQGWVTSYFLGFREGDLLRWGLYVDKLKSSHIRLIDNEESLVWTHTTWSINHKQGLQLYSINVFENNQSGGGRLFAISISPQSTNISCGFYWGWNIWPGTFFIAEESTNQVDVVYQCARSPTSFFQQNVVTGSKFKTMVG